MDVDAPVLPAAALEFMGGLPTAWDRELAGVRVAVRHATPRSDMEGIHPHEATVGDVWTWLREAKADVLIVGHTHTPFALSAAGGGLIDNPGALLGDPAPDALVSGCPRRRRRRGPARGGEGGYPRPNRALTAES